jgi:hypothetical protein
VIASIGVYDVWGKTFLGTDDNCGVDDNENEKNSIREGTEMNRAMEEKERSPESGNAYI